MSFISKILDAFKLESTREMEKAADNSSRRKEMTISEACAEIDRANKLADIANKTTDREEFYNAMSEIEGILTELSKYENKFSFSYPPSTNLRDLRCGRNKQIELLEKRIEEKEITSDFASNEARKNDILNEDSKEISENIICEKKSESICETLQEVVTHSAVCEKSADFDYKNQDEIQRESHEEAEEEIRSSDKYYSEIKEESYCYRSKRLIIGGLHIYFISVAREILEQNAINIIPLMREYKLSEDDIKQIIQEMQESNVIDESKNPMMTLDEFERFVDIYEPELFKCRNGLFNKKNFLDIGEIIFDEGAEAVYDILPANEIIDYLNIMEKLKILSYDDYRNKYDILVSREEFYDICKSVPNFLKDEESSEQEINIDNMDGHEFEYFCADILRKNGFENVEVTQGSGDHGIDILAEKHEITYAIQCKCYSSDVGNAAVQQAHTGKSIYKKDIAVVLTNRYFTAQAKEEAAALGVKLWDRDKLNSMIEKS